MAEHLVMKCQKPSQVLSGLESLAHIHVGSWLPQCTASFQPKLHPTFHETLASLKNKQLIILEKYHDSKTSRA